MSNTEPRVITDCLRRKLL